MAAPQQQQNTPKADEVDPEAVSHAQLVEAMLRLHNQQLAIGERLERIERRLSRLETWRDWWTPTLRYLWATFGASVYSWLREGNWDRDTETPEAGDTEAAQGYQRSYNAQDDSMHG